MRVASIVYLDFLDAHGGYYTATVYIHLHSFFAIQFNFRKTPLSMFHVESHRFLLLVSSWVIVVVATMATVANIVAGGCVCWCCWRELALLQEGVGVMPTNRVEKQVLNLTPFSLSCSHFLLKLSSKKKQKISAAAPQCHCYSNSAITPL